MDFFDDIFPNEDDGEIDELSRYVQEHVMNKNQILLPSGKLNLKNGHACR